MARTTAPRDGHTALPVRAPTRWASRRRRTSPSTTRRAHTYLAHRLRLAGTELPLFEAPTVEAIYQASSGLPRKANGLAHHALFAAAIAKAKAVTTEHVQIAMQEVA